MLFLLIAWLALLVVCVPTGLAVLSWIRAEDVFAKTGDRLLVSVWLGLCVFGSALLALALVLPISSLVAAITGALIVSVSLLGRTIRVMLRQMITVISKRGSLAGITFLALGASIFSSQALVWTDTGLYHAGAIQWIHQFGAVHGIALVNPSLGFTSSWFALTAPFAAEAIKEHVGAVVGGFAFFLLMLQAVLCLNRVLARQGQRADWLVTFGSLLLVPTVIWWKLPVSPNPDLAVDILPLVIAWSIVITYAQNGTKLGDTRAVPLILAAGAVAIKLSAAPLLLVTAMYYLANGVNRHRVTSLMLITVAMLLPAFTFSFITSGCPFFPAGLCSNVSWSVGSDVSEGLARGIQNFARWSVDPGAQSSLDSSNWIPHWLHSGQNLLFLTILGFAAIPSRKRLRGDRWLLALGFAGALFILYSAPALRFGLGYAAVLLATACLTRLEGLERSLKLALSIFRVKQLPMYGLASLLVVSGVALSVARLVRPTVNRSETLASFSPIIPPPMGKPDVYLRRANGADYLVANGGLCWMARVPCTQVSYVDWIVMGQKIYLRDRKKGIKAGFRRGPAPNS